MHATQRVRRQICVKTCFYLIIYNFFGSFFAKKEQKRPCGKHILTGRRGCRSPAASFFALPQDKKPPHSVGRCPVGAEEENIAIARNISGSRTVLSPTACGRSPLPEGAKGRTRLFLQSEPPHSAGRWPSKVMAGGALPVLPRLTAPPSCTPTPDSPRSPCGTRVGCAPTVYHIVTNKKHRLPSTGKRCLFIKLSD